jgi:hypothetical protein
MDSKDLQERLDFLLKELYTHNITVDDARDELEVELKEFMSEELYESFNQRLDTEEELMFQNDWSMVAE